MDKLVVTWILYIIWTLTNNPFSITENLSMSHFGCSLSFLLLVIFFSSRVQIFYFYSFSFKILKLELKWWYIYSKKVLKGLNDIFVLKIRMWRILFKNSSKSILTPYLTKSKPNSCSAHSKSCTNSSCSFVKSRW